MCAGFAAHVINSNMLPDGTMTQGQLLTPEQIERVADSFEINPHWRAAANYAGVAESTLYDYRKRAENYTKRNGDIGDESDPDHYHWQAVQTWTAARNRLETRCAVGLLEHGVKDWRALQVILKALAPQDWSDRVELTGAGGGPISVESKVAELLEEAGPRAEAALAEIEAKRKAAGIE